MTAVVALGSNVGDRLSWLRLAVRVLQPTAVSSVWETAPVGGMEQDDFLNAVVLVDAAGADVWSRAVEAERLAERERVVRWGPRTLDVDLVVAEGPVPGLDLPHPRAHERAFVLAPWYEVDGAAVLPGHGRVCDLLQVLGTDGVRRRDDLVLA